jgi:Type I phosphodiesterase / nucleotide pyrophosphatase
MRLCVVSLCLALGSPAFGAATQVPQPHNVILFVADGLRARSVEAATAPALAAVRDEGVDFANSHSLFPTVTTANASAIATGHGLGDTGNFGNTLSIRKPFPAPYAAPFATLEDDVALGLLNERFEGNYLGETSLLAAARAKGFATAAIGKTGPSAIQDVTARDGKATIIVDDGTGWPGGDGIPLAPEIAAAIKAAGLAPAIPDRGLNGSPGAYNMPGVHVANVEQQDWLTDVAVKVLLPRFKAAGKPFVMVFWSRDPDGTQHNQGDSLNTLTPGINGPTSLAGIANASKDLGRLREALTRLGLAATTDLVVTADHGFATLSRCSATSAAARMRFADVPPGLLPPGFMAIDMAAALDLKLFDPLGAPLKPSDGDYPRHASALLGANADRPQVVIAANGGALIYLPDADARTLAPRIVNFLTGEDYVGALFVRDALGSIPGALPTSAIGLAGTARTPPPDLVVGFASFGTGCADPERCGAEVAETDLQQGQGIHGTFGRQDTHNFMAAIGPDFRSRFRDPSPVSNADLAPTIARIRGVELPQVGHNTGRVLGEALAGDGAPVQSLQRTRVSEPAANGFVTRLDMQEAAGTSYFDAAGASGRTIGLRP